MIQSTSLNSPYSLQEKQYFKNFHNFKKLIKFKQVRVDFV